MNGKKAIENYWNQAITKAELDETLLNLQRENLLLQKNHHLDSVPVGDFSLYDHILDTSLLFNIIPERFQGREVDDDLLLILHVVIKNTSQVHSLNGLIQTITILYLNGTMSHLN